MDKVYAIYSPGGGIREDIPTILLPDVYTPGDPTCNVIFEEGVIKKGKGRRLEFPQLPNSQEINLLVHFEKTNGERYFIAGTKSKIFYWSGNGWTDITGDLTLSGSDLDYWNFAFFGDNLLLTNGVDPILKWKGQGYNFELLGGNPPRAKFITNFKNYVILGNLQDYPNRICWSAIGDMENWTGGDSGEAIIDDVQEITGFGKTTDYLVIFKKFAIYVLHFVGGSLIFNCIKRVERVGCLAPYSVCVLNNRVYFFGANKRFFVFDGIEAHNISEAVRETLDRIKEENFKLIYGFTLESLNRIVWLIPEGDVVRCNRILILDVETGTWFKYSIDGNVFGIGGYALETNETWETMIEKPDIVWGNVDPDWKWSDIFYTTGERISVIGGSDSKVYRLFATTDDKGEEFNGIFVTKKIGFDNPNIVKRVLLMQHYFKNEGMDREVKVAVKLDNNTYFEQEESFNLYGVNQEEFLIFNHYVDCVCKTLQLKIEGADNWQYIGTIFYYTELGLR